MQLIVCALALSASIFADRPGNEPRGESSRPSALVVAPIERGEVPYQGAASRRSPVWYERRLDGVMQYAHVIPWDRQSRFVLFSDCHRGDKDQEDIFAQNEGLFLEALDYYLRNGFTYIEVGDGDDLWGQYDFQEIESAYPEVFNLFRQFMAVSRLHLILGNHELLDRGADAYSKGEFELSEGLVLKNSATGPSILIVHGHQADQFSDRFQAVSRQVVHHLWSRIKHTAWAQTMYDAMLQIEHTRIEVRIARWVDRSQTAVITGHTHQLHFPEPGFLPIFNTGNCSVPGSIFGLEIREAKIWPIVWQELEEVSGEAARCERVILSSPFDLELYPEPAAAPAR